MAKNQVLDLTDMMTFLKTFDEFIVCDTESTGFHPNNTNDSYIRLIEVAGIRVKNGKVVEEFSELINPGIKISKKISEITGITTEMVKDCPNYQTVLRKFNVFCKNDSIPMVFHNAPHDLNFLNYFGQKAGCYSFGTMTIDTLKLSRHYLVGRKSHKLEELCKDLGISDENHHRALNDVYATYHFLKYLLQNDKVKNDIEKANELKCANSSKKETNNFKCNVLRYNYWEKEIKGNNYQRLYILIGDGDDKANVFYDFIRQDWGVKDSSFLQEIDYTAVKKALIAKAKISEMDFEKVERWKR